MYPSVDMHSLARFASASRAALLSELCPTLTLPSGLNTLCEAIRIRNFKEANAILNDPQADLILLWVSRKNETAFSYLIDTLFRESPTMDGDFKNCVDLCMRMVQIATDPKVFTSGRIVEQPVIRQMLIMLKQMRENKYHAYMFYEMLMRMFMKRLIERANEFGWTLEDLGVGEIEEEMIKELLPDVAGQFVDDTGGDVGGEAGDDVGDDVGDDADIGEDMMIRIDEVNDSRIRRYGMIGDDYDDDSDNGARDDEDMW